MSSLAITAVIPNYNHAQLLRRAVQRLQEQSVPPTEIIVVDDCSDEVCWMEGVRIIRHPKNRGTNCALNTGLYLVKTPLVYFGAADDYVLPGFFEKAVRAFEGAPNAGLFYCPAWWHDARTSLTWRMGTDTGHWATSFIPTSSMVCRTEETIAVGGFQELLGCYADWFLARRLAKGFGYRFSSTPGSRFHLNPDAYSSQGASKEVLRELAWAVRSCFAPWGIQSAMLSQFGMPMKALCPDLPLVPCLRRSAEVWARKHLPARIQKQLLQSYYAH